MNHCIDSKTKARYFDLVIRNADVYTGLDHFFGDIAISNGKIVKLAKNLGAAKKDINANGSLVLPGGIDSHCHIDQPTGDSSRMADDFSSGTRSALCGGTTTIIPFALQEKGDSLIHTVTNYHVKATGHAFCDYGFHIIITDIRNGETLQEITRLAKIGYTSFKIYMTYESLKMSDYDILEILSVISQVNGVAMIHAENDECIRWLTDQLIKSKKTVARFHAVSRPEIVEAEAVYRAITLGEISGSTVLIVHVSSRQAFENISNAKMRGCNVYAETCPQYLFLTKDDLERHGEIISGRYICSPPPRDKENQKYVWENLINGNVDIFSSDHAPFNDDCCGKRIPESKQGFHKIPNGLPGLETRLALLLSEVLTRKNISINDFVKITALNQAKLFGLYPKKGVISVGSDADIVIWKKRKVIIRNKNLHHAVNYTPYEKMEVQVWPEVVFLRGNIVFKYPNFVPDIPEGEFLKRNSR